MNTEKAMKSTDVYRDSDYRYEHDPAFHAAVQWLENMAALHGFTPGELRQIAFKASLNIEERRFAASVYRKEASP